ncbi:hypothetical protein Lal_00038111 [Lupinus albus]|nr:hypothetical protein Lal_00038111 [Lupinus albus]
MALRVKVQPSYNQSSVIRLSEDPNLIKTILDQIVIFQPTNSDDMKAKSDINDSFQLDSVSASHIFFYKIYTAKSVSITADHDPDLLQVLTPANDYRLTLMWTSYKVHCIILPSCHLQRWQSISTLTDLVISSH